MRDIEIPFEMRERLLRVERDAMAALRAFHDFVGAQPGDEVRLAMELGMVMQRLEVALSVLSPMPAPTDDDDVPY